MTRRAHLMRRLIPAVVAAGSVVIATAVSAPLANADAPSDTGTHGIVVHASPASEAVAASVLDLAPADAAITSSQIVEPAGDPASPDSPLTARSTQLPLDGSGEVELAQRGPVMSLPREAPVGRAEVTDEGLVVYPGQEKDDVSVAVGVTTGPDGGLTTAVHTVIQDADSPREYTYDISGAIPVLDDDDGGVSLMADHAAGAGQDEGTALSGAKAQRLLASIAKPWAVDAHGVPVPTRFMVRGRALVQTVDFQPTTAFPVVADPSVRSCDFWTAACVKFSRSETRSVNDAMLGPAAAGIAQLCSLIPAAGWGIAIKMVCAATVALVYWVVRSTFNRAKAEGKCVEVKWGVVPVAGLRGWNIVSC